MLKSSLKSLLKALQMALLKASLKASQMASLKASLKAYQMASLKASRMASLKAWWGTDEKDLQSPPKMRGHDGNAQCRRYPAERSRKERVR